MKKQNDEISIRDLIGLIIPKLWIVVICAVALSLILGGYAIFLKKDTYTSSASLKVSKDTTTNINPSDMSLYSMIIEDMEGVVLSYNFLEKVSSDINANPDYSERDWNLSPQYLKGVISIIPKGETSIFKVSVTTTDPLMSKAITESVVDRIEDGTLSSFLGKGYDLILMTEIDPPTYTEIPNNKGIFTNILVGFLAGAVLSMVVIYIVAMFDVIIHDRKKLEDTFDIPVLGVIPRYDVTEDKVVGGKGQ